jgi:hypothetical protein
MPPYNQRDHLGRFTKSGAPIPDAEGQGDTSAYENVDALSARPGTDPEAFPSFVQAYPDHEVPGLSYDPSHGGYQRRIPHRHVVVVDTQTGQEMAYKIDHEVRGLDTYLGGGDLRADMHLQAGGHDPLISSLMARPGDDSGKYMSHELTDHVNTDPTHTSWPGEVGRPLRERP